MPVAARYRTPRWSLGLREIVTSFGPFLALWALMYLTRDVGYWLTLLLAVPAAGFLMRIFIIQHDCGHGSFLRSQRVMDWVGSVAGIMTLVPYEDWRHSHAIHHAGAGRLSDRGVGDICTWTVREYESRGPWARFGYRIYRNPFVLFVLGPLYLFVIRYRLPGLGKDARRKDVASALLTNLAIAGIIVLAGFTIGVRNFFLVQAPITIIASTIGVWLFYVQHQFEDTYWSDGSEWDYTAAALRGSSYYRLPGVLQWFAGNIGFHHIHHLSPRIPGYLLEQCHRENPMFQDVPTLTLRTSLRTIPLALWDEDGRRLISFGELRRKRAA